MTALIEDDPDGVSGELLDSVNQQIPGIPFNLNETYIIIETLSVFSSRQNLSSNTTNNLLTSLNSILVNGVEVDEENENEQAELRQDFNE